MRKTMSKTRTSEDRMLDDAELDVVSGGVTPTPTPKLYETACKGTHLPEVVIEVR
jgi:type VI protein secretion system component Hcp